RGRGVPGQRPLHPQRAAAAGAQPSGAVLAGRVAAAGAQRERLERAGRGRHHPRLEPAPVSVRPRMAPAGAAGERRARGPGATGTAGRRRRPVRAVVPGAALHGDATPQERTGCHHCAEPLPANPARPVLGGGTRERRSEGCAAAAEWIQAARLGDYYRLRTAPASRIDEDALDDDLSLWDREEIPAEHARNVPGGREITLLTDGMRCAACAWLIDRALSREEGVVETVANAVTGRIRLTWDPSRTALSAPLRRLAALGYR